MKALLRWKICDGEYYESSKSYLEMSKYYEIRSQPILGAEIIILGFCTKIDRIIWNIDRKYEDCEYEIFLKTSFGSNIDYDRGSFESIGWDVEVRKIDDEDLS